jgi:hypothetical protein
MCRDNMFKLKSVTALIGFFARRVITGGVIYLFIGVERTIAIKSTVLIGLQVDTLESPL